MAKRGRNLCLELLGPGGLEDALLLGLAEASRIDGDEDIRRTQIAFLADPGQKRVRLSFDDVDLDAGLFGESPKQRIVGVVVTSGIDVHFTLGHRRRGEGGGKGEYENEKANHGRGSEASVETHSQQAPHTSPTGAGWQPDSPVKQGLNHPPSTNVPPPPAKSRS